jgi:hypothetical protein
MKRELIEKIYKQKFECEKEIETYNCDKKHYLQSIKELENNVSFCEELLDIIVKDE